MREALVKALKKVLDPELKRSLVDLNMVRGLTESEGRVEVTLALPIRGCPMRGVIHRDVEKALLAVPGVRQVRVRWAVMDDGERAGLLANVRGGIEKRTAGAPAPAGFGPQTHVIAVGAGRGGAGKSTVAANLALALADLGYEVGLVDADIYTSAIPQLLGVKDYPKVFRRSIVPVVARGVQVISMGLLVDEDLPVTWYGEQAAEALAQFLNDVLWAELDYLIVDLPPATVEMPAALAELAPAARLLFVGEGRTATAVREEKALRFFDHLGLEVLGRVVNRSDGETLRPAEDVLARIPADRAVAAAEEAGIPLLRANPTAPAARAIGLLAERVTELWPSARTARAAGQE